MALIRKQVVLDDEKIPAVVELAAQQRVSFSAIVRWAIDQYLASFSLPKNSNISIIETTKPTPPSTPVI